MNYYMDSVNGDDLNLGTSVDTAWKTFAKSKAVVVPGDVVHLASGNYGTYSEVDVDRIEGTVTYLGDGDGNAIIENIVIRNAVQSRAGLLFLRLNIEPAWVDPCNSGLIGCDDPYYSESTQSTYSSTTHCVETNNSSHLGVTSCNLIGTSRFLTPSGAYIQNSNNIFINLCDISVVTHGCRNISSYDCDYSSNHIHAHAGTGVNFIGINNYGTLVDRNWIHDGLYSVDEPYAPRALGQDIHGSGVSIRDKGVTVTNNIIHDCATTSGIRLYEDDAGYTYDNSDILIENNLIYDLGALSPLEFSQVGTNVVVRNNISCNSRRTDTTFGAGVYRTAFSILTFQGNATVGGINVHNNIFIGICTLDHDNIMENNNICWSYTAPGSFVYIPNGAARGSDTHIYTSDDNDPSELLLDLFNIDERINFTKGHGLALNFTNTRQSMAYNFGDVATQSPKSLGKIVDNFIASNGKDRDSTNHSAGAYEQFVIPSYHRPSKFNGSNNKYKYPIQQEIIDADLINGEYMYLVGVPVAKSEADLVADLVANNNNQLYKCTPKNGIWQYSHSLTNAQDVSVKIWADTCWLISNLTDTAGNQLVDSNVDNLISIGEI